MLGPINSDWTPLTHLWCHQRCAEPVCPDHRHDDQPRRDTCEELFAAERPTCRPFWKHLERINHIDRYEPGRRDAVKPEPSRSPARTTPAASLGGAKIGETSPVRTPDARARIEVAYRMSKDLGAGRVMDLLA